MSSPTLEEEVASAPIHAEPAENEVIVSVQGVSKHYKLWRSPSERLRYSVLSQAHKVARSILPTTSAPVVSLTRRRQTLYRDFSALHELSFEVRRGESIGIIGRNGSGKSTLLQIIAGTLQPSTGHVDVYGRVAALLELGSGFNLEFTGRENVYMNASILGLDRDTIDAKFDEIAGFADIGEFIDQAVKTYSSGMMVRLAFAVQMAVEPMLFIIDEALAVGDIYFQSKCNKLLKKKLADGMTLLLVSHDPGSIRALCARAVVLDHGRAVFIGPSDEGTSVYHAINSGALAGKELASAVASQSAGVAASPGKSDSDPLEAAISQGEIGPEDAGYPSRVMERLAAAIPEGISRFQDEIGDGSLTLTGCALFDANGRPTQGFVAGESIRAGFSFVPKEDFTEDELIACFQVRDKFNNVVAAGTSINGGVEMPAFRAGQRYVLLMRLRGRLGLGKYLLDFGLGSDPDHADSARHYHHRIGGIAAFQVDWFDRKVTFQGICDLSAQFSPAQLATAKLP